MTYYVMHVTRSGPVFWDSVNNGYELKYTKENLDLLIHKNLVPPMLGTLSWNLKRLCWTHTMYRRQICCASRKVW